MTTSTSQRHALVTGSSRGLGLHIARTLLDEGYRVAINGRDRGTLTQTAATLGESVIVVEGDVTRPDEARRVVSEATAAFGPLDAVVCNVGSGTSVRPGDESPEEWERVFGINLWSATNIVETAKDSMRVPSAIVCISSICGVEVVPGAPVTYSVAKAALNAYVKGIARPLGERSIRINAICPGNLEFEGSKWSDRLRQDRAAVEAMLAAEVPLKRLGTAREIADLVAYLVSPKASFVTGSVWTIDGGQTRA